VKGSRKLSTAERIRNAIIMVQHDPTTTVRLFCTNAEEAVKIQEAFKRCRSKWKVPKTLKAAIDRVDETIAIIYYDED
jgi:hypothetical protein